MTRRPVRVRLFTFQHPRCVIHIDLRGEKVWLQHDSTDADIANTLVEMGIPAEHIVLGFQPEHYRQHTGFAIH